MQCSCLINSYTMVEITSVFTSNFAIATVILMPRFDKHIIIFDISLYDYGRNRFCILGFRNFKTKDFTVVTYRDLHLSFGLLP